MISFHPSHDEKENTGRSHEAKVEKKTFANAIPDNRARLNAICPADIVGDVSI